MGRKMNSESYKKVAKTAKKKADRFWAKAKQGEGDHNYLNAKKGYDTYRKATEKAKELDN